MMSNSLTRLGFLPGGASFFTLSGMGSTFRGFGDALRYLREQRRLTQEEVARRSKLDAAMLSRYEREARMPHLDTLAEILSGLDASLNDLSRALDVVNLRAPEQLPGKPRGRWVSGLTLRARFDLDSLEGFLHGALDPGDESAEADFVVSVETAARGLAQEALRQFRSRAGDPQKSQPYPILEERALQVAENEPPRRRRAGKPPK